MQQAMVTVENPFLPPIKKELFACTATIFDMEKYKRLV